MAVTVGPLLRDWRERRRMSQLDLSSVTGVSTRHLSTIETGRSRPSRELVLYLADELEVPLRDRNTLLVAAGFAPTYRQSSWDAPELTAVREMVESYLQAIAPNPALAMDRLWNVRTANSGVGLLLEGVPAELLEPVPNVLRVTFHPDGLSSRILNLPEVAHDVLARVHRQILLTGDEELAELLAEIRTYPGAAADDRRPSTEGGSDVAIPLRLQHRSGALRFLTAMMTFGTAVDVTLAELSVETFFPADDATRARLARRAGRLSPSPLRGGACASS